MQQEAGHFNPCHVNIYPMIDQRPNQCPSVPENSNLILLLQNLEHQWNQKWATTLQSDARNEMKEIDLFSALDENPTENGVNIMKMLVFRNKRRHRRLNKQAKS